ncbi:HtaA domain-containing protein [Citricoccus parietis]|uniref:HtaA domain-containing protein n=1 Tax=Citricoccus parietis TaxID=592307 RepID=A0ABV6F7S5_9MICC
MKTPIHRRVLRWVAMATAVLLASLGLTALPASAAPTVSITEVPDGGGQVTVSGAGFSAEAPGIYLGIGPSGLPGFYQGSGSLLEDQTVYVSPTAEVGDSEMGRTERMQADGTFTFTTTLPTEPEGGLAAYTSKAHGQGLADPSQNSITPITYAEPAPAVPPLLTATEVPAAGGEFTVTGTNFSTEGPGVYLGVAPTSAGGFYAASNSGAISQADTVSVPAARISTEGSFTATLTAPAGDGTSYSVFSSKARGQGVGDPSQDASVVLEFAPAPTPEPTPTPTDEPSTPAPAPTDEPSTPAPDNGAPRVTASAPDNGTVTVNGTGFSTAAPGIYVGLGEAGQAGFYQASSAGVLVEGQTVAVATEYENGSIDMGRTAELNADGSFSLSVALPSGADASDYAIYTSKAHGQGRTDTSQDVIVRLSNSAPSEGSGTPGAGEDNGGATPAPASTSPNASGGQGAGGGSGNSTDNGGDDQPEATDTKPVYKTVCAANEVSGATLSWGLKSSFRNYIRGGIAQGGWTLGGGASYSGSAFTFGGGNGSYAKDSRTGTVTFGGSVHFTGHDGVLDMNLSNLRFRQTSPSSAEIIADVTSSSMEGDGFSRSNVTFATVNTSNLSVGQNSVSLNGASATLTAAGAEAFAGFYEAGTALDPISLTLPLGEGADCQQVLVADGTGQYATGQEPGSVQLASTGAETTALIAAGGGLLALGALALVLVRRQQGSHAA